MIVALDVQYKDPSAIAVAVGFSTWDQEAPSATMASRIDNVAPYEPGAFYKRELPCLLRVIEDFEREYGSIALFVVDGYCDLGPDHPGLGRRLFDALPLQYGIQRPVIGVAKTSFAGAASVEVLRGASQNPLYVTAVGVSNEMAAARISDMGGKNRLPTLLKLVDSIARDEAKRQL